MLNFIFTKINLIFLYAISTHWYIYMFEYIMYNRCTVILSLTLHNHIVFWCLFHRIFWFLSLFTMELLHFCFFVCFLDFFSSLLLFFIIHWVIVKSLHYKYFVAQSSWLIRFADISSILSHLCTHTFIYSHIHIHISMYIWGHIVHIILIIWVIVLGCCASLII